MTLGVPATARGWRPCAGALLVAAAWGFPAAAHAQIPTSREPVVVEADDIEGNTEQDVRASGQVDLRQGPLRIEADSLRYNQSTDRAQALGNVRLSSGDNWFKGPEVQLTLGSFEGFFERPEYYIGRTQAGGSASRWDFLGRNKAVAHDATYTSCPRDGSGDPAWVLEADRVHLNLEDNVGRAEGGVLRFYGVPILAAPSFTFPVTDARKSGWLPPHIATDNKAGFQFGVPYYWNMAPNRDMTLTPSISANRGAGLETEFRYLEPSFEGRLKYHVLPYDQLTKRSRRAFSLSHDGVLPGNTLYSLSGRRVSDGEYWKDFTRGVTDTTPRLLDGEAKVYRHFDHWTPYLRIKRWQVLQDEDTTLPLLEAPYDRLPQVGVRMMQPLPGGFQLGLETEYNRFVNPHGYVDDVRVARLAPRLTGSRAHALGSISWPHATPGWTFVPKVGVNAATYSLDRPMTAGPYLGRTEVSRVIPSFSVDSAWTFERDTRWLGRDIRQTLEPRMLYVRTGYRPQAGLPTFDTAVRDFNADSIYTDNMFSGVDRVSDANQLTAGVSTRFISAETGAEQARLGIAQRILFSDQRVTPDDGPPVTQNASDVLLFGSSNISRRWYLDGALQYNFEHKRTARSVIGARYTAPGYRTVALAYRLKDGESEQVDLSWQWPLYGHARRRAAASETASCQGAWYAAGRVNYSLLESRVTDSVAAFEYDSGCWIGRMMVRRQSTSLREATTQIGLEIEFVGLSRLGTNNPLRVLKDNIPGYRPLRNDSSALDAP